MQQKHPCHGAASCEPERVPSHRPPRSGRSGGRAATAREPADDRHLDLDAHIIRLLRALYAAGAQSWNTTELHRAARSPSVSPKTRRRITNMSSVGQTHVEEAVPDADPVSDDSGTAIAVVIDFVGATLSQVDQLLKAMRLAAGGSSSTSRLSSSHDPLSTASVSPRSGSRGSPSSSSKPRWSSVGSAGRHGHRRRSGPVPLHRRVGRPREHASSCLRVHEMAKR